MSSNNPNSSPEVVATELTLERLREYIAGGLALIIVLGMILICFIAIQNLAVEESFQHAKDLLLIITPFVGVVLGYYFNKVTSDARASSLQRTADAASQTAISATAETQTAQAQAAQATQEAEKVRGALTEMVSASENVVPAAGESGKLGTLGAAPSAQPTQANIDFQIALERARRALNS